MSQIKLQLLAVNSEFLTRHEVDGQGNKTGRQ